MKFSRFALATVMALVYSSAVIAQQLPSPTFNNLTMQGNLTLPSKPANNVFVAPDGLAGVPSFRSLVSGDIPSLDASKIGSGTLPVLRGGTGVTTSTGSGSNVLNTSPAFTGSPSVITNVSPTGDGSNFVIQNSAKTAVNIYGPIIPPGWFFWDNIRSSVDAQPGMSIQGLHSYGAYTYNNVPAATLTGTDNNVVGLFVDGVNAVAGAKSWGLNTSCGDSINNTIPTSVASTCIGYEIDFTVYNTGTSVEGLPMLIQGPVAPASANGIHISTAAGSTAKWTNGFISDNGAVNGTAVKIGATAASGSNIPSQPIKLGFFDSGAINRDLTLQSNNNSLNITSTSTGDGLALQVATANPRVIAFGSSTDINLNYDAKGTGTHIFNAGASFAGATSVTGSLSATTSVSGASVTGTTVTGNTSVTSPKFIGSTALPTPSTCGTSPTVAAGSGNNAGKFTFGTGTVTACTVTFANAYATNSFCTITPASNFTGTFYISAQSNTGFILTTSANAASQSFNYTCFGN